MHTTTVRSKTEVSKWATSCSIMTVKQMLKQPLIQTLREYYCGKRKQCTLPLKKKPQIREIFWDLTIGSMHSLVHSQVSELPTCYQVTSGCFYTVGATLYIVASSCAIQDLRTVRQGPSYTFMRSSGFRPHCTSCQDQNRLQLNRAQWTPAFLVPPCPGFPFDILSRQALLRSQCSLEKMSLFGRSWHD